MLAELLLSLKQTLYTWYAGVFCALPSWFVIDSFSVLTLYIGWQEGILDCKNILLQQSRKVLLLRTTYGGPLANPPGVISYVEKETGKKAERN